MTTQAPASRLPRPLARAVGFVLFLFAFLHALIMANLQLAAVVLFKRKEDLNPGFIVYRVNGLSRFEIFVLAQCISLTPGTATVEISRDYQRLLIHSLDTEAPELVCKDIRRTLEAPILRWTR
ncbi:MAG TPA: Na+/H+ antiporter subunit E [Myxococcaceae bacterium]|nr:Na+/H+ antiporter subunit E [Myxococcaceae bacterium]